MRSAEIRQSFLDFFARARPPRLSQRAAGAAVGDPTLLFTNAGMVPVQGLLHSAPRRRRATARHHVAEVPARLGQAQRPRERRAEPAPPHLLRDARQLLVRRLLQGRGDRVRLGAGDQGLGARSGGTSSPPIFEQDDEACELWRKIAGLPADAHRPLRQEGQLLGDGRHRSLRSVQRDLRRPASPTCRRCPGTRAADCGRYLEIWNLVFMQFDAHARRRADAAAQAVDRHRRRPRAGRPPCSSACASNYDTDLFQPILARRGRARRQALRRRRRPTTSRCAWSPTTCARSASCSPTA